MTEMMLVRLRDGRAVIISREKTVEFLINYHLEQYWIVDG